MKEPLEILQNQAIFTNSKILKMLLQQKRILFNVQICGIIFVFCLKHSLKKDIFCVNLLKSFNLLNNESIKLLLLEKYMLSYLELVTFQMQIKSNPLRKKVAF